jgi:hypothetical protein
MFAQQRCEFPRGSKANHAKAGVRSGQLGRGPKQQRRLMSLDRRLLRDAASKAPGRAIPEKSSPINGLAGWSSSDE